MGRPKANYLDATRHPWPCLLFLFPLLLAYEVGVLWLGGKHPEALRNGADAWLRWGLEGVGLHQLYWAPALVVVVFVIWTWSRRHDRPEDSVGLWIGMTTESALFALGLWGISRGLGPALDFLGVTLRTPPPNPVVANVITYVGAGIYEELLFRLFLFSGFAWFLVQLGSYEAVAVVAASVASAALFAAAHHWPSGEPYDGFKFLFRAVAGLYFALLYRLRGFGIAVGAHAGYDVLVGALFTSDPR